MRNSNGPVKLEIVSVDITSLEIGFTTPKNRTAVRIQLKALLKVTASVQLASWNRLKMPDGARISTGMKQNQN